MKGLAADPNIARYVDDIYAYLQARADGVLGRAGWSNRTVVAGRELHSRTESPTGSRAVLRIVVCRRCANSRSPIGSVAPVVQPTGSRKAAIAGDLVLAPKEVNLVLRALRTNGME